MIRIPETVSGCPAKETFRCNSCEELKEDVATYLVCGECYKEIGTALTRATKVINECASDARRCNAREAFYRGVGIASTGFFYALIIIGLASIVETVSRLL